MAKIQAIGGFDKELELRLLKDRVKIHYLEDALVFDEKVASQQVFKKQRTRWLAAQFRYAFQSIPDATWALLTRGKVDYFDKSFQFLLIPRLILLGIVSIGFLMALFPVIPFRGWLISMALVCGSSLLLAVPRRYFSLKALSAIAHLPTTFISMLLALVNMKKAKNNFLHTPHQVTES